MPNWCSNRVTVRGSLEQFNEFREYVGNGKTIEELEKVENIDDSLLRYLTVRVKKLDLEKNFFEKKETGNILK